MTTLQASKFAGPEWRETTEKKASGILAEELNRRGWNPEQLEHLRKADPDKLKIAKRLREETTVTWQWIAQHLSMGAPGYVANCLRTAQQ
jgi:hypothetical protein